MIRILGFAALVAVSVLMAQTIVSAQAPTARTGGILWYKSPAPIWDHVLPVGNGRLGAIVFGGANSGTNNGDLAGTKRSHAPEEWGFVIC
jgi:alpha-L-fucosidase 2